MADIDAEHRIGPYQVVSRLGGGAMGTVHLARSPGGRLVAVKVARPELAGDPRFRERFRREIEAARAVGGFWTATVVDADPDAPQPWLATEYVPGPDLHDAVRASGALPPESVRGLAAGLAEALAAIHAAGVVHRDLKPSNVLLAADGPRVIDFGIAKALEGAGLTHTGMVIGTPGYLSPEQIEGREVGPAADVFAFGAVVAFAASGRNPFGEGDTAALLYRAVHTRPDLRDVPHDLRELISRCLEHKARARPTATELVAALGGTTETEWLPAAVKTMVEQRATEVVAARPPTRVLPGDHLSAKARWWLERGAPVYPPYTPPGPDEPAPPAPTPDPGPPSAPLPVPQVAAAEPRIGMAERLRRAVAAATAQPEQAQQPGPAQQAPAAQQAAQTPPVQTPPAQKPSAQKPAFQEAGAKPPAAAQAPAAAPVLTSARSAMGKWWAKALGWVEQAPPPPPPEPKQQLADRVSKLVEQAREAMGEVEPVTGKKAKKAARAKAKAARPAKPGKSERDGRPERKAGNQAVFATRRSPRLVSAAVGVGGGLLLLAAATEAAQTGRQGVAVLVLVAAALLAIVAVRRAAQAIAPRRGVEVTAAALSWRRGATTTTLKWPRVARVRIVEDKDRPWLVVWPRDPSALDAKPDYHGGYRAYPIAHGRSAKARAREVEELRAALSWYGRSAYDPG